MPHPDRRAGLFPALLKHWRRQRGMSQLDLALAADVSARHVSFLETGRSTPSPEMVLALANALAVPLRQVNALLRAAGHEPRYEEPDGTIPPAVRDSLELLKVHHDPFPLVVVDRTYDVLDLNGGALRVFDAVLGADVVAHHLEAALAGTPLNLARLTFAPDGAQPHLANFDQIGRDLLWRIQREVLDDPDDGEMQELLDDLLAMGTVDAGWRHVDLTVPSDPALVLHLRNSRVDLRFVTMITAFQAPQDVRVEHLRIETWLPYDEATADACRRLAAG